MQNQTENLADDLIWGAKGIAEFIGVNRRRAYWLLEQGQIPGRKIGDAWVGSKIALRERFLSPRNDTTEAA